MMKKKTTKEELWCEYSGMPSPMAYSDCTDYDSMGDFSRFTKKPKKRSVWTKIAKIFKK